MTPEGDIEVKSGSVPGAQKSRRRFRAQVALICLAAVVLLVFGLRFVQNDRGRQVWEQTKQDLETAGEKLDAESFIPPPVPDAENAAMAPIFAPVIAALGAETGAKDSPAMAELKQLDVNAIATNGRSLPRHGSWQVGRTSVADNTSMSPAEVLDGLKRFEPQLRAFSDAMQRARCRFPLRYDKGIAMPVSHTMILIRFAKILHVRALAELGVGDGEAALADTLTLERAANAIRDEPLLISHLVRLTLLDQFLDLVWRGTADKRWNDAQLQTIARELAGLDLLRDHARVIRGERAFLNQYCEQLRHNRTDALAAFTMPAGIEDARPRMLSWTTRLLPRSAFLFQNQATANRWIQQLYLPVVDPDTRRVYPRRQTAADEVVQKIPVSTYNILAKLTVPVYANIAMRTALIEVGIRQARVACALERFRLLTGKLPEGLRTLIPEFMESEIPDLFVEEPFRYRLHGDKDYILYSVGWNSVDDNGEVVNRAGNVYKRDNERGDWVWFGSTAP